jgi:hypothetical protein
MRADRPELTREELKAKRASRPYRIALVIIVASTMLSGGLAWSYQHLVDLDERILVAAALAWIVAIAVSLLLIRRTGIPLRRELLPSWRRGESRVPTGPPSLELAREMAGRGMRIQAIKVVREVTGASLEEAHKQVKKMEHDNRTSKDDESGDGHDAGA